MKKKLLLLGMVMAVITISCNKDDATDDSATSDVVASQKMDSAIDDVSVIADDQYEVYEGTPSGRGGLDYTTMLPSCAIVSDLGSTTSVRKLTITFGTATEGCLFRGHSLRGKIILTRTISPNFPKIMTISYDGFYVDGHKLEGEIIWKREMIETAGSLHPKTTLTMRDVKLTTAAGAYIRNGIRITEMTGGFATYGNHEDDVFTTSGQFSTTFPNGDIYTSYISSSFPLVNKTACSLLTPPMPFPVSGILNLSKNDHHKSIDYGDGNCDNLAMVSIDGGVAFQITLGN